LRRTVELTSGIDPAITGEPSEEQPVDCAGPVEPNG
jgi:hypothetical protein